MDRASKGLDLRLLATLPAHGDVPGIPPNRPSAIALVVRGDELMDESEHEKALAFYQAAAEFDDRDVAAAGYFGAGNALYRMDRELDARKSWENATTFGETPVAYRAWRQVAAALVREGDLPGALKAYRQAEKRAPREDRAEIAGRLGWLNKETGNTRAAGRYFARSRGDSLPSLMTYLIIGVTVVTSFASISAGNNGGHGLGNQLLNQLELNKLAVAHGDYYRLFTVTLVHDPSSFTNFLLHLGFNMYALWYAGQLVERMYGSAMMLVMYVICGIAGSVLTYVFGDAPAGVGASGAIFGLFGVVVVATRYHHAVLDAQSRAIASQIGVLIVLNLVIGFSGALNVDNFAHVGGLLAGLWLAAIIPPGQVPTLGSMWQARREGSRSGTELIALRLAGVVALLAVVGAGIAVGTSRWQSMPIYRIIYGLGSPPGHAAQVVAYIVEPAGSTRLVVR